MKREYDYENGVVKHITTKIYRIEKIALNFFKVGDVKRNKPKRCGISGKKLTDEDMVALLFTDKGNVIAKNSFAKRFISSEGNIEFYDWSDDEYYCHDCDIWFKKSKGMCPECKSNDKVTT